jgi:hypothetical protein
VDERPPSARTLLTLAAPAAALSALVTGLRLTGELRGWSPAWFSPETGGTQPHGWTWVIGITWLPVLFGPWFAWRLWTLGQRPASAMRTVTLALLGLVGAQIGLRLVVPHVPLSFPPILLVIWLVMVLAAVLQLRGWPAMVRVLLVYALLSRAVVAVVMLLAMRGQWGTHYDYVGMPEPFQMPLLPRFFWLAFFPQLVFWAAFTVVLGSLFGGFTALALERRGPARP